MQGRPYSIETSFTRWLELSLEASDQSKTWEVVNCGGVSYASYRLVPIMEEALNYGPDLFIVYTGHNEFLEERTYGEIKRQPQWLENAHHRFRHVRLYGLARQWFRPTNASSKPSELTAEVNALLDYQGGLEKYHRDDERRDSISLHHESNLRRMVRIANDANVPIIFVNPVSNLRDTPPFKAETPAENVAEFERLWMEAKNASWDDLAAKLAAVNDALSLAPRHAEVIFLKARVLEAAGDFQSAKREYHACQRRRHLPAANAGIDARIAYTRGTIHTVSADRCSKAIRR